jgi:hypothetical protein
MELVFFVEWCQVFMICTSEPELLPNKRHQKVPQFNGRSAGKHRILNAINI